MTIISSSKSINLIFWYIILSTYIIFVGLRHKTGMDWGNYIFMIEAANIGSWMDALTVAEPGYATILYISGQLGFGIYGAYLIGTIIFMIGLFKYALTTPNPWIALMVAYPYLIVVISMSGARQSLAMGCLFFLFASWKKSSLFYRVSIIMLASLFHLSAIIALFLISSNLNANKTYKIILNLFLLFVTIYAVFELDIFNYFISTYFEENINSSIIIANGALPHVLLNAGPAMFAMALGGRFKNFLLPDELHSKLAIFSILTIILLGISTVAASRLSIYFFPVSMMVFSSIPNLSKSPEGVILIKIFLSILFFLILFIWLSFATNAHTWRTYSNALFVDKSELTLCCK